MIKVMYDEYETFDYKYEHLYYETLIRFIDKSLYTDLWAIKPKAEQVGMSKTVV